MPAIDIPEDLYEKVREFKQVVEGILEESVDVDTCVRIILNQGMNSMLNDLIGPVDHETLVQSFQQLGRAYPKQVYRYVAETLLVGKEVRERESLKRQIGFLNGR